MIDLEDRLQALADDVTVPPTDSAADLARGRRRQRRRHIAVACASGVAAAVVVVGAGVVPDMLTADPPRDVGPANSGTTRAPYDTADDPQQYPAGLLSASESGIRADVESALGLEEAPLELMMVRRPDYDPSGMMVTASTSMGVRVPGRERVAQVDVVVARTWEQTAWRTGYSCHPGCETYELDGRTVETGTYDGGWGWAHQRADGTVVTVWLGIDPDRVGVERSEVDRLLQRVSLSSERDEPAGWGGALLDMAMTHLPTGDYSLRTGASGLGPSLHASYVDGPEDLGELTWEGELLDTAPTGCPAEFSRCERRVIDGVEVTLKHIGEGIEKGYVWVENDGDRVRSRVLLEPYGNAWVVALDRVAALLADPTWQEMPDSQSVPSR
ncbi:hypothetical protein EUA06_06220 [Nocardioides glacieisoli]|uniref:Uncharacterized protein n=1 Tax=Nocardioides glacieisoli TaxID=1168730 RepID=A0A4Q2RXB0_9ACTN|nr:hypothetical protein [Nocardioides glacieisoli]RYB92539.1 hypothetical protein EUA06_06220 [Nocardioides glacieisoli]